MRAARWAVAVPLLGIALLALSAGLISRVSPPDALLRASCRSPAAAPSPADAATAPLRANETAAREAAERVLAEAVLADWRLCRVLFHVHIAKTGGTSLMWYNSDVSKGLLQYVATGYAEQKGAARAVTNIRKRLEAASAGGQAPGEWPLGISVETMHGLLLDAGYAWDADTCFFATVREPSAWAQSAFNHVVQKHPDRPPWAANYFTATRDAQTAFFERMGGARAVTIVQMDHMAFLTRLLSAHFSERGYAVHGEPARKNWRSQRAGYIADVDWRPYTRANNALDLELLELFRGLPAMHFRPTSLTPNQPQRDAWDAVLGARAAAGVPRPPPAAEHALHGQYAAFQRITARFHWQPPPLPLRQFLLQAGRADLVQRFEPLAAADAA